MITFKNLEKYIDDGILENMYKKREKYLYHIADNKEISELLKHHHMTYERLLLVVKNLPPHFNNIREEIEIALEQYTIREKIIQSYDNEKFYKSGFCDGARTILECLQKEREFFLIQ